MTILFGLKRFFAGLKFGEVTKIARTGGRIDVVRQSEFL